MEEEQFNLLQAVWEKNPVFCYHDVVLASRGPGVVLMCQEFNKIKWNHEIYKLRSSFLSDPTPPVEHKDFLPKLIPLSQPPTPEDIHWER